MNIDAYIPVGGNSTRFGTDKATFEFGGMTLAERAVNTVKQAIDPATVTFVAAQPEQFPTLAGRMIFDVYPGRGSAGAVHSALNDSSSEWIFVLACDLPFVTAKFIVFLRSVVSDQWDAVVPIQPDGQWQSLCAFYRVEKCHDVFESALIQEGHHLSLRAIIETVRTRTVGFSEYQELSDALRLLRNVNSRIDLDNI